MHTDENKVIQSLAQDLLKLCNQEFSGEIIATPQHDITTFLDQQFNSLIIETLQLNFNYPILSEETSSNMSINSDHIWVIDPLCGSRNANSGIRIFCTNIVLVENSRPSAAWVIDYLSSRIIWGVGNSEVFSGEQRIKKSKQLTGIQRVNIDWGHYFELKKFDLQKYAEFVQSLIVKEGYQLLALDSSLALAYVATGQIQVATIVNTYPWDFLAAAFLVEQNGGKVSNMDGSPWGISSKNLIFAGSKKIHQSLLEIANKHKLFNIKEKKL